MKELIESVKRRYVQGLLSLVDAIALIEDIKYNFPA
jgi:hypothetical protein